LGLLGGSMILYPEKVILDHEICLNAYGTLHGFEFDEADMALDEFKRLNEVKDVTAKARILKGTAASGTTIKTTLTIEAIDGKDVISTNSTGRSRSESVRVGTAPSSSWRSRSATRDSSNSSRRSSERTWTVKIAGAQENSSPQRSASSR
jgi:hypothetical protein